MLSPAGPRSGLRNLGYPTSTARRPGALNFDPVMEDRGHGAAVARRGAGALSAMPRCYASIPCGSEAILPHDVARGYFRRGDEGVGVPGSACPQRAGPPGRSVTSATISVRNSAFPVGASPLLCSALHYRMAEQSGGSMAYPRWVGRVADRPQSLGNAWSNRPGRRVPDTLCSRPPLWGSDRRLPHWAAGLLGRGDVRMRGCPSTTALAGPSFAVGVATPVAGCAGQGPGLCCGLVDLRRARTRRLGW